MSLEKLVVMDLKCLNFTKMVNLIYYQNGETNYTQERLELFNVQQFTGDNSTKTFTLSNDMDTNTDRLQFLLIVLEKQHCRF